MECDIRHVSIEVLIEERRDNRVRMDIQSLMNLDRHENRRQVIGNRVLCHDVILRVTVKKLPNSVSTIVWVRVHPLRIIVIEAAVSSKFFHNRP